jgi:CTP:molybdopterin cytidylyltransferase MocA
MGATKQLKLWPTAGGPKPLICAAYDAIRPICDEMIVVLGHEADAVAAALEAHRFRRAESDADQPMFESVRIGLRAALAVDATATVVLQPGDHPEVADSTLRTLVSSSRKRPDRAIIPQYDDRGGHPVLIPASIAALVLESGCPQGLKQFWLDHPELCCRVLVDDPTMLRDVDTPADLMR